MLIFKKKLFLPLKHFLLKSLTSKLVKLETYQQLSMSFTENVMVRQMNLLGILMIFENYLKIILQSI